MKCRSVGRIGTGEGTQSGKRKLAFLKMAIEDEINFVDIFLVTLLASKQYSCIVTC